MLVAVASMVLTASASDQSREQVVKLVTQIQRADYEGDRAALKRLHGELTPFAGSPDLATRVLYWQGFALWRRAINGFNDKVAPAELQEDLQHALVEFDEATKKDPAFVDAKIGALSCAGILAYSVRQQDAQGPQTTELIARSRQLRKEIEAAAPDNPRFLWVEGPIYWNVPPEHGGGQAKAIELYRKGLEAIRNQKAPAADPLDPSWGEPELFMSLAWSNLNRTEPNVNSAEQEAESALKLVPYWHYVRDILLPQIREAKRKTELENHAPSPPSGRHGMHV